MSYIVEINDKVIFISGSRLRPAISRAVIQYLRERKIIKTPIEITLKIKVKKWIRKAF